MHILIFTMYCKDLSSCLFKALLKIQKIQNTLCHFLTLFSKHFPQSTKTKNKLEQTVLVLQDMPSHFKQVLYIYMYIW